MNKLLVYELEDGGVGIITPAPQARLALFKHYINSKGEILEIDIEGDQIPLQIIQSVKTPKEGSEVGEFEITQVTYDAVFENESDEQFLERIASGSIPAGKSWKVIDSTDLPKDRAFRNAWEALEEKISVNMPKAKEIFVDNVRVERAQKFIELGFPVRLDPDLEASIIPQETRDKLQALRDITDTIRPIVETAETPEQLLEIKPFNQE